MQSHGGVDAPHQKRARTNTLVQNRVQFEVKMGLSEVKHKDSMTRYRGLVHLIKLVQNMDRNEVAALVSLQKTPSQDIILSVVSATFVEYAEGSGGVGSTGKERMAALHLLEGLCLIEPFFAQRLGSVKGVELLTSYVMGKQSRIPARFDSTTREKIRIAACWALLALIGKADDNCQTFVDTKGPAKLTWIIENDLNSRRMQAAAVVSVSMLMAEPVDAASEGRQKLVGELQLAVAQLPGHGHLDAMMEAGRRLLEDHAKGVGAHDDVLESDFTRLVLGLRT